MARRIGIYSGTFDPVHAGHITFAQEALKQCALSEVVFLPEAQPRGKRNVTTTAHRVALLERALGTTPQLRVMRLDSLQFTVHHTLPELRRHFTDATFTLLVGSDVARTIPLWPGADMLLSEMSLAVGIRAGDDETEIAALLPSATIITTKHGGLASSQVRSGSGYFFNAAVAAYASEHSLYPA